MRMFSLCHFSPVTLRFMLSIIILPAMPPMFRHAISIAMLTEPRFDFFAMPRVDTRKLLLSAMLFSLDMMMISLMPSALPRLSLRCRCDACLRRGACVTRALSACARYVSRVERMICAPDIADFAYGCYACFCYMRHAAPYAIATPLITRYA